MKGAKVFGQLPKSWNFKMPYIMAYMHYPFEFKPSNVDQ